MNEIQNEGNDNIIIQDVSNSTITVNANGEIKKIKNDLETLINLLKKHQATKVQNGEKIYNIDELKNGNFADIIHQTHYHYHYKQGETTTHPFYLWVLSGRKSDIDKKAQKEIEKRYGESSTTWQPFENDKNIAEIIKEYKNKVDFEVRERFLAINPIQEEEETQFYKTIDKIVLLLDPFIIQNKDHEFLQNFNSDKTGGFLILICQSVSFELFSYIREKLDFMKNFKKPYKCYLDYKEKYFHFMFPISTKELLFRTLSNIAFAHLKIASQIRGLDTSGKTRNNTFQF